MRHNRRRLPAWKGRSDKEACLNYVDILRESKTPGRFDWTLRAQVYNMNDGGECFLSYLYVRPRIHCRRKVAVVDYTPYRSVRWFLYVWPRVGWWGGKTNENGPRADDKN